MPASVAALLAVHRTDAYPDRWPSDPAAWLTPAHLLDAWVARDGGGVFGHVALATLDEGIDGDLIRSAQASAGELALIKRLFVHPDARGRGLAAALLAESVRYAHARRLRPVLETAADVPGIVRFYERNGWRPIGSAVANWSRASGEHPMLRHFELRGRESRARSRDLP